MVKLGIELFITQNNFIWKGCKYIALLDYNICSVWPIKSSNQPIEMEDNLSPREYFVEGSEWR